MNVSLNADWLVFTTHGVLLDFLEPPKDGAEAEIVFKLVLLQDAVNKLVDLVLLVVGLVVLTTGNKILWSGLSSWELREPEIERYKSCCVNHSKNTFSFRRH